MMDVNIFNELFLSTEMWGYLGPMLMVIVGYYLAKREAWLGVFWFIVECLFVSVYLDLVDVTPQYWWNVMILLLGGLFSCVYPLVERR